MKRMFFRREQPKNPTFADRIASLPKAGFTTTAQSGGAVRVSRANCAVDLNEENGTVHAGVAGVTMGDEIGALVDGGFQKFFRAPSGKNRPALADDLKEALGQESYYNQSLGTVSTFYLYDRVKDRDRGVPKRVWE
jgi:hypothetical protein